MSESESGPGRDRLAEVQAMSLQERQAAIEAGVVEDLDSAHVEVQEFAERARQCYLDQFGTG